MFDENVILGQDESYGKVKGGVFGGGDSLSWHGGYTGLGYDSRDFYDLFKARLGGLRRHPTEGFSTYYRHPWDGRITRDQLSGALFAILSQRNHKALFKIWLHHGAWLWLFDYSTRDNDTRKPRWKWPDLTVSNIWQFYVRGLIDFLPILKWPLVPLLLFFDLMLLADSLVVLYKDDSHIISHLNRIIPANKFTPTVVSRMALRIMPTAFIEDNLKKYWCGWRGNCHMVKRYMEVINGIKKE